MFVYLDHAHFAALSDTLRSEPAVFADFLAFWLENECQLIVSRAHLHEIGQSEDERDVEKRLEVLRYFSIWSGASDENVDWVIIREIRQQTLQRLQHGMTRPTDPYAGVREALYQPVDHSDIEDFIWRYRPGLLDELSVRREYAAFENRVLTLQKEFRSLSKRKEPKWNPDAWRMASVARSRMPGMSGDPVADRWMAEVQSRQGECWSRARRKRQALVCMYDLGGLATLDRVPEQDLSRLGFYRALAQHWVAPYCQRAGHDPNAVQAALNSFDPYDAPAISASLAVRRGRKTHEKEYEASDFMDVDHVMWAAHADLAFIDRRTHGFLLQAMKNPATAQLLSPHLRVRYERAAKLDDVKNRITARAEERLRDGD